MQAVKATPHIYQGSEKEPLWYYQVVLDTVIFLHQRNGDQEGCRLDLRPFSDES
jgi:hypothetical protein